MGCSSALQTSSRRIQPGGRPLQLLQTKLTRYWTWTSAAFCSGKPGRSAAWDRPTVVGERHAVPVQAPISHFHSSDNPLPSSTPSALPPPPPLAGRAGDAAVYVELEPVPAVRPYDCAWVLHGRVPIVRPPRTSA